MHINVEPSSLYFGTPVVLISTLNKDGTTNVAPMSSAWWLGWNGLLGLGMSGKTAENLLREKEAVLNLPSVTQVDAVNRLAKTTGTDPVPAWKRSVGYRHEKDKLGVGELSESASDLVKARRVNECPVQTEAVLAAHWSISKRPDGSPAAAAFHLKILRVHAEKSVLAAGEEITSTRMRGGHSS